MRFASSTSAISPDPLRDGRAAWSDYEMIRRIFLAGSVFLASASAAQQAEYAALPLPPTQQLSEHRRVSSALAALKPQRRGIIDAYVIVVALDSDPVFGREAREAGRVLARRFDAAGRTWVLADDDGTAKADAPGSPHTLALALARAAEVMDRQEDVLVLYSTSHGLPRHGLVYKDMGRGGGTISPARLAQMIDPLGFRNRLFMLQACYSGQFVPALKEARTIVVTAAAADRSSFGCQAGNDWTLFGDALINHALREPAQLQVQLRRASDMIATVETAAGLKPSNPQVAIGAGAGAWLSVLDARAPKVATKPVGQPIPGLGL